MSDDNPTALYAALMAVVMFYAIHETALVLFAFRTSGELVNLSIVVFMFFLMRGLRSWWPFLYVLGNQMNRTVLSFNRGLMPVFGEAPVKGHIAASPESRLTWFADWIYFWGHASSPGDILIVLSLCGTLWILGRRVFGRTA